MEKLKMHSPNLVEQNIEKLADLFPNCVTESKGVDGKLQQAIDFDLLKQELSRNIVEGPQERYQLNWPGKREALLTANAPIAKTLRPCREESVNFDTTQNLFIEGDNLDALKLLQETYLGKVKMIYIDPPYNTGKDFIYEDDFSEEINDYLKKSGQKDANENRLVVNTESNGRFHSDWLSMMYSRLKMSRNLMTEDGVIFISVDINEITNTDKICSEIFGESNRIGLISRATGTRMGTGSRGIARELDYIIVYTRNPTSSLNVLPMTPEEMAIYNEQDERGLYLTRSLRRTGGENRREDRPSMFYPVLSPEGDEIYPIAPEGWESRWVCGQETYKQLQNDNYIVWKKVSKGGNAVWQVYQKHYISEGREPSDLWTEIDGNKKATKEVNSIFDGKKIFDHPKPVSVIQRIIQLGTSAKKEDIILDFFSGSATTAHAVMKLNAEDGGNRKFIMVQLPELCNEKSEAFKAGYKYISEISKERIRRAGKKIAEAVHSASWNKDIGCRVLKIDTSNMSDIYYTPDGVTQNDLFDQVENVKSDRTEEDLLFQIMLDWGVDLSLPIRRKTIAKKTVYFVDAQSDNNHGALVACFDKNGGVDEEFIKQLATFNPLRLVFRDAGFSSDSTKINVEQLLKQLSPATDVKTI
jgi:adenine-specific DNA-methyltransferase